MNNQTVIIHPVKTGDSRGLKKSWKKGIRTGMRDAAPFRAVRAVVDVFPRRCWCFLPTTIAQ
jgi:hypothetical protein